GELNTFPKKLFKKFISFAIPKITFSALAKRIFVINLFPLIFFLFLIPALREDLIQDKKEALEDQLQGFASTITETIVEVPTGTITRVERLKHLVRGEHLRTQSRIKVFRSNGDLLVDSIKLVSKSQLKPVRSEDLFRKDTFIGSIKNFFDDLINRSLYWNIPFYGQSAMHSEQTQVQAALRGESPVYLLRGGSGVLMTAAAPIFHVNQLSITGLVVGSIHRVSEGDRVDQAIKTQTYESLSYLSL
ncbi:uncharacterized protein METZ01_LOCUS474700, partial [marine metagenome]